MEEKETFTRQEETLPENSPSAKTVGWREGVLSSVLWCGTKDGSPGLLEGATGAQELPFWLGGTTPGLPAHLKGVPLLTEASGLTSHTMSLL